MKILWPPAYYTDGNKMIFLFDIYYMAYLSFSYAVILFEEGNGKTKNVKLDCHVTYKQYKR